MENETAPTYRLHLYRTIKASAEQAFRAFTDPELLFRWFMTSAQTDLRKDSQYSNADGDRDTYLEINAPNRLTFTWDNPPV